MDDTALVIWLGFYNFLIHENLVSLSSHIQISGVQHLHVGFRRQRQIDLEENLYRDFTVREGLPPVDSSWTVVYFLPSTLIQVIFKPLCSFYFSLVRK